MIGWQTIHFDVYGHCGQIVLSLCRRFLLHRIDRSFERMERSKTLLTSHQTLKLFTSRPMQHREELRQIYRQRQKNKISKMVHLNNVYANIGQGYYAVNIRDIGDKMMAICPLDLRLIPVVLHQPCIISCDDKVGVDTVLLELTYQQKPRVTLKFASPETKEHFIAQLSEIMSNNSGRNSDASSVESAATP